MAHNNGEGRLRHRGLATLVAAALGIVACQSYVGGSNATIFLSGRLVGPGGDPATSCHAGAEDHGEVAEWRTVDTDFREMFLLPSDRMEHRIVIQCRGYLEHTVLVTAARAQWRVGGTDYRTNQTVPLGVIVLTPG